MIEACCIAHDPRVVLDIRSAGHAVDQTCNVRGTTDFVEIATAMQFVTERDEIDHNSFASQRAYRREHALMCIAVEIVL